MYMQRTASGAAGNGLYTTIKCMRGASGIGMGTTAKHLRRTTSDAGTMRRGHGPCAGTMRDGGSEDDECDAGEEPEEHPDDGEDEDEEEGEVHQDDSGGGEDTGAVDYAEVEVDVDRDDHAGGY